MRFLIMVSNLMLLFSAFGNEQDWPQWGGPDRSFVVKRATPLSPNWDASGPNILWEAAIGPGHSGIVARAGAVFTAYREDDDDVFVCFDASNGSRRWEHRDHALSRPFMIGEYGAGPHSTPLIGKDLIYFIGSTGHLVALDQRTGKRRWKVRLWDDFDGTPLERGYAASPLAFENTIIVPVGGDGTAVVAFDHQSGKRVWASQSFDATYASPVLLRIGYNTQVCALLKNELIGLDPFSGELLWETPINSSRYAICSTPVTGPGARVTVVSRSGAELYSISQARSGDFRVEREWQSRLIGSQDHNVLRVGSTLIGSNSSTTMTMLDVASGEALDRTRNNADASVLYADGKLISLSEYGELALSKMENGTIVELARAQILSSRCWSAPALVGSTLFVRDLEQILAVDIGYQ